jgi:hypothetical protein
MISCWHYDHSQQRNVKGINFVTCLYINAGLSFPVGFELISKTGTIHRSEERHEKTPFACNQKRAF